MARKNGLQAQHDEFMRQPGISPAQVKIAETWLQFATAEEVRKVGLWTAERKAKNTAKRRELADRISELQSELADIKRDAEQGLRPYPELLKERRLAIQHLRNLEGVYASLESTEATVEAIAGDPVGYMDSIYEKYAGLAHQRPKLATYLAKHPADRPYR